MALLYFQDSKCYNSRSVENFPGTVLTLLVTRIVLRNSTMNMNCVNDPAERFVKIAQSCIYLARSEERRQDIFKLIKILCSASLSKKRYYKGSGIKIFKAMTCPPSISYFNFLPVISNIVNDYIVKINN